MIEVKLPKLREDVDESLVVIWFVSEGDAAKKGDPLLEIQTEKEVSEIEAETSGTIKEIVFKRGESAKVGEVLATIDPTGKTQETKPEEQKMVEKEEPENTAAIKSQQPEEQEMTGKAEKQEEVSGQKEPEKAMRLAPGLRKLARELNVPIESIAGTGRNGKVTEKDIRRVAGQAEVIEAAGKVNKEAPAKEAALEKRTEDKFEAKAVQKETATAEMPKENQFEEVQGNKFGKEERSIELPHEEEQEEEPEHKELQDGEAASLEQEAVNAEEDSESRQIDAVPLSGIRGAIARKMVESLQSSAQLTETAWADVTKLEAKKNQLGKDIGWTALIANAVAQTLSEYPILNTHIQEQQIKPSREIHLGFAVDTENGLQVAVLQQAGKYSPAKLQKRLAELAEKARKGKLSGQESSGSTFTITNLGAHRVQFFTPIINPPEVAILGIGQIENYLVMKKGKVQERKRLPLSLTIDHRAVDGAPAARFLGDLIELLEKPKRILKEEKKKKEKAEKKKKKES